MRELRGFLMQLERMRDIAAAATQIEACPSDGLEALAAELGARIKYSCGAEHCRLLGIGASATMDRPAAIQAWARAARRRLEQQVESERPA